MEPLSLVDILKVFNNPISEEQAWAVCYQCSRFLYDQPLQDHYQTIVDSGMQSVCLSRHGDVHLRTHQAGDDFPGDNHSPANTCPGVRTEPPKPQPRVMATESHAVRALGTMIYETLDYGIDAAEERQLSRGLESLIAVMTKAEGWSEGQLEVPIDAVDEGIVRDANVECWCSFEDVIKMCSQHVTSNQDAEQHYRAVCRALATEAGELFTFLDRIATAKEKLSDDQAVEARRLEELQLADWACMWVQVVRSLRQGVCLKKVEHINLPPVEYELTPFEILLEDIRSRRYTLHTTTVKTEIPVRVRNNAHDVILEFIRSRPPLRKVDDLKLKKTRSRSPDLHERLLREIRSKPKLRPVRDGKLVVATSRAQLHMDSDQDPPSPARKIIKPDLSLLFQHSLEESSAEEEARRSCSLTSSPLLDTSIASGATSPYSPPWHRADVFLFDNKSQPPATLHRRHTINVCDTPRHRKKNCIEYLSLTLGELTHIRSVFTTAEMESLAWRPELYQQVSKNKLCFTCRTTRFTLFGEWGSKCKICQRTVCSKCIRKMNVPIDHFRNIPVYTLSPSLMTSEIRDLVNKTTRSAPAPSVPQTRASSPSRVQEMADHLHKQHKLRKPDSAESLVGGTSKNITDQSTHVDGIQSFKKSGHKKGSPIEQSLKGPLMAICCKCREMVSEIVRSSRTSLAAVSISNSSCQSSGTNLSHKTDATSRSART